MSRRAMHEAVLSQDTLMERHRQNIASHYHGRGGAVISVDWTFSYHSYPSLITLARET